MSAPFLSRVICAVCETEREIRRQEIPVFKCLWISIAWALLSALSAGVFISWSWSLVMGLLGGGLCFAFLEVYYHAKLKRELVCPVCQFDPVLYRRSPEQARSRCLEGLKRREQVFMAKWQALGQTPSKEGKG